MPTLRWELAPPASEADRASDAAIAALRRALEGGALVNGGRVTELAPTDAPPIVESTHTRAMRTRMPSARVCQRMLSTPGPFRLGAVFVIATSPSLSSPPYPTAVADVDDPSRAIATPGVP